MAQDEIASPVVVIGGSAGSLEVIIKMISNLEATHAIIIIVVHRKHTGDSILVDLLSAKTRVPVREIEDKDPIIPGTIHIVPSDYHLLIEDENTFSLDASEKLHYSRPSIDVTFESVAEVFGSACVGIILSGANADGTFGVECISNAGGTTIAQDPSYAEVGFMPRSAIDSGHVQKVMTPDQLGALLKQI